MDLFKSMDNDKLVDGKYYGKVIRRDEFAGFILTETIYSPGVVLPKHSHRNAYFCLILRGNYTEIIVGKRANVVR